MAGLEYITVIDADGQGKKWILEDAETQTLEAENFGHLLSILGHHNNGWKLVNSILISKTVTNNADNSVHTYKYKHILCRVV